MHVPPPSANTFAQPSFAAPEQRKTSLPPRLHLQLKNSDFDEGEELLRPPPESSWSGRSPRPARVAPVASLRAVGA